MPKNIRLLCLSPYSPELNPQERLWDELREKYLRNRVLDSIYMLENHVLNALGDLENAPTLINSITG
ncbi:hypothetical protein [Nitrosomonas communis]|uniref:hypothetical protein n=1 Tax=Nitrosomonas communis TaxID=44574 RepID=UPI003D2CAE0A